MDDRTEPVRTRKGKPDKRKIPRKVTKSYLENSARYYLERFASSSENLRAVLMRRVVRSSHHHATDPEEGAAWIAEIIMRFQEAGLLDDKVYASGRIRSLHARGNSRKSIRLKLRAKGIDADLIDDALTEIGDEEAGDLDMIAARSFAKRRRLGPYRKPQDREAFRDKDMASLARAGFSYQIARQIIDADAP